jgi:hypothetical protein
MKNFVLLAFFCFVLTKAFAAESVQSSSETAMAIALPSDAIGMTKINSGKIVKVNKLFPLSAGTTFYTRPFY